MKPSLRLAVLLVLGAITLLAFIPLFFAIRAYTELAFDRALSEGALSETLALGEVLRNRPESEGDTMLRRVLPENPRPSSLVVAACSYDSKGRLTNTFGPKALTSLCAEAIDSGRPTGSQAVTGGHILTSAQVGEYRLVTLARAEPATRPSALLNIIALYMGLFALLLLGGSYVGLTHFLVRPLDDVSRAAKRVADGGRRFSPTEPSLAEISELNQSLSTMTDHLIGREAALQSKIEEVERATISLKQAQERLVRSERLASVGRLSAGVAHEIGNPLAAILGLQDLILSERISPGEQREFTLLMRKETERIHRILRDLLQFARPARVGSDGASPGNVLSSVTETLALVKPQSAFRSLTLVDEVEPNLPQVTMPDAQLTQVLLNLLLNAADATSDEGSIRLSAKLRDNLVEIAVEDTGAGVSAEVREHLFEPFVTTKEVGKGTGLGLAVCRGLVEAAQGTLYLDSGYSPGARFVIELPTVVSKPLSG